MLAMMQWKNARTRSKRAGFFSKSESARSYEQERLKDFDRKFYTVPYAPKDYHDYDDQLDVILRGVIGRKVIRIDYAGLAGEGKQHDFEPYTLLAYHGGLYVLGLNRLYRKVIYLAVERIR